MNMQNHNLPLKSEIWLILDSSGFGGIESHVFQLAKGLQKAHERIRIIFLGDHGPHPLHQQLAKQNIPFFVCKPHWLCLLSELLKKMPSLIHTHGYKAGIIGRGLSTLLRIKCVSTFHAGERLTGKLAIYNWLDHKTAPLADHVCAVSPEISERIPTLNQKINNFVDTSSKQALTSGTHIAFVGRLSHEKGPDLFLQLAEKNPEHTFHIYGDGPMASSLKSKQLNNVVFHGYEKDMDKIWKKVGLLIMPSRHEGLPMVALEAMSKGIPVLATQVGALPDLIDHKHNGWLVLPEDVPALNYSLNTWLRMSTEKRHIFSSAAVNKIQKEFSNTAVVPKYQAIYRRLLSTKTR